VRWDGLSLRDRIDVAYAALTEPMTSGAWGSLDEALDGLDEALSKVLPDVDSFGESATAQRGMARAEELFPDARSRPRKPKPPEPAKSVGTGNPLGDALARTLSEQ